MKTALTCLALTTAAVWYALPAVVLVGGLLVVGWLALEPRERDW